MFFSLSIEGQAALQTNNMTISKNKIAVKDYTAGCLIVSVPNGWDDVKNLTSKVLGFDGKDFTFRGWNSDRDEAYFKVATKMAIIK